MQLAEMITHLQNFSPEERGVLFERYCKWFLENDPRYAMQLKKVWLWKEWDGKWGRDKGIDLIAETWDGKIWAIQVKAYDPAYYVTKEDVDKFLSESSRRDIHFRLLIATTNNIGSNAQEVITAQEKPVGLCLLDNLEASDLDWAFALKPHPTAVAKKEQRVPRPHQQRALQDIVQGFAQHSYGQLHMACGTGKTLVGLWLAEALDADIVLVLVPSLSLVSQLYREWASNCSDTFQLDPIFICSDDTVGDQDEEPERFLEKATDLGFPVTTNADELVKQFAPTSRKKVIFSTYHSSPVIKEACLSEPSFQFDLVIADEAHRCAGKAQSAFATIVDHKAIRSKHKIFMTATPKIFSEHVKTKTRELEYDIVSMDDEEKFGPVFHKLPFSQAIAQNLLSDYQVLISVMDNKTYQEYAQRGRFVMLDGHETDARTLASQLLVAKAIKQYDLKKVITFHNRKKNANQFIKNFSVVQSALQDHDKPTLGFADVVFGEMSQAQRNKILSKFKEPSEGCALLGSVKCLSEGVDVPALDGIAFIDPRGSEIDIVQAVGRVIRKPQNQNQKIGTIIIPIFVDGVVDETTALEDSCFQPVWKVVKALRAHDDVLAEKLDTIRLELGKRSKNKPVKLSSKITINVPVKLGVDFSEAVRVKLVERCSLQSWRSFEDAREFIQGLGLQNATEWRMYIDGETLRLPKMPNDIPKAPWSVYAGKGWISLGNWLGTDFIATAKRQYVEFAIAREYVHSLKLKSRTTWSKLLKEGLIPQDIPAHPDRTYKKEGWIGWGDFLGTGTIAYKNRTLKSFEEARAVVRTLGLKNQNAWFQYAKTNALSEDIPAYPSEVYASKGWISWGDWLGTDRVASQNCVFRPFQDARAFVRSLGLKNNQEWRLWAKGSDKPKDIPAAADRIYADSGWSGWGDFFGTGSLLHKNFSSYAEARAFARQLGLKSRSEWYNWIKTNIRPADIPSNPGKTYLHKGWAGWGDFLGTGNVAYFNREFRSFEEARIFARNLYLKNKEDWVAWAKSGNRPADIPAAPSKTYADKGWIGWANWLAT